MRKLTVAALARELDTLLRDRYPVVLVEGEVGNLQVPASSGHCYLTLRDKEPGLVGQQAVLPCVVWADTWRNLRFKPKLGDRVVCRGRLGVYGQRGNYQLYVTDVQPAGVGDLARQIAERTERLRADGLLDPSRKRSLPAFPRFVGVATSLTGAALQDFLKVSRDRFPAARILVAGCQVQGVDAPPSVVRAVDLLVQDGRSQVIVVTRGGGSKEDLLAFQDEQLARFLAGCPVPVVSAVGHEIDTTIADLVADAVAPTPSAAALLVLPDGAALRQRVDETAAALRRGVDRAIRVRADRVAGLRARLRHPGERLRDVRRRAIALDERLLLALGRLIERRRGDASRWTGRLEPAARAVTLDRRRRVQALAGRLDALSPLAVLARGYAIASGPRGVLVDAGAVQAGDLVEVRLARGRLTTVVRDVED